MDEKDIVAIEARIAYLELQQEIHQRKLFEIDEEIRELNTKLMFERASLNRTEADTTLERYSIFEENDE